MAPNHCIACCWLLLTASISPTSTHSPTTTPIGPSASSWPVVKVSSGGVVFIRPGKGIVRVHHLGGLLLSLQMSGVLGRWRAAVHRACTDWRHVHVVAACPAVRTATAHPRPSRETATLVRGAAAVGGHDHVAVGRWWRADLLWRGHAVVGGHGHVIIGNFGV